MARRRARKTRWLLEGLLVVGILGVLAAIGARVLRFSQAEDPAHFDVTRPGIDRARVQAPARPHHIHDYLRDPTSVRRHVSFTLSTNSEGLRGPEFSVEKPAGVQRVLCAGECVTFGSGVDDDQTYSSRLSELLRETYPGRTIEVLNGGHPDMLPADIVDRLATQFVRYSPDLVLLAPGTDTVFLPEHVGARPSRVWLSDDTYERTLRAYRANLERAIDLARAHDFSLVFVTPTFNTFALPDTVKWTDELKRVAHEREIPLVDTTALFQALERQDGLALETDGEIHRLVAYDDGVGEVLLETAFTEDDGSMHVAPAIYEYLDRHPRVVPLLSLDSNHPNAEGHEVIARALHDTIVDGNLLSEATNP